MVDERAHGGQCLELRAPRQVFDELTTELCCALPPVGGGDELALGLRPGFNPRQPKQQYDA